MSSKRTVIIRAEPLAVQREDAAKALSVSVSTLEEIVRQGRLPPPRQISAGRTGWLWRELVEFSENLPVSRLSPGPGRQAPPADPPSA